MVTSTTSTTATPTPTATPNAQTVVKTATQQLLTSLNTGSGIDTGALVPALVEAQFAARTAALTAKTTMLTSQISGISSLKSAISAFSTALASLAKGGTLQTQPVSSDTGALGVSAISGAALSGLTSTVSVTRLASAQVVRTASAIPVAKRADSLNTGPLTLTIGARTDNTDPVPKMNDKGNPVLDADGQQVMQPPGTVWTGMSAASKSTQINVGNGNLDTIVSAINAAKTGVIASVVTDSAGNAFLSVRGASGDEQAFTLTGNGTGTPDAPSAGADAINIGPGAANTSVTTFAQNAQLTVDGIEVERPGNTISDLVDGVKLQLNTVSKGPIALTSSTPTDGLTQAVEDVVETYNQVLAIITEQTDPINGALRADPAAASLLRSLRSLTLQPLIGGSASNGPTTLAEIGVGTNRDGTFSLDSKLLAKQLAASPGRIEAMFAPATANSTGLSAILTALTTSATSTTLGLGASTARYTKASTDIATQQAKITTESAQLTDRLTQQYASMNSRVTAYKATQTFLTNQIAAWNKSDS